MSSPQQAHRRNSFSLFSSGNSQSSHAPPGSSIAEQLQRPLAPRRWQSHNHTAAQNIRPMTPANWPLRSPLPSPQPQQTYVSDAPVQQPRTTANEVPGRTGTAFSEANTLVRGDSVRSRSSIAKGYALHDEAGGGGGPLRSIFPTYDHSVPLAEQHYAPAQLGPTRLPRAVISRQSVYEEPELFPSREIMTTHGHGAAAAMPASPPRPAVVRGRWPLRIQTQTPPVVPTPCSTADLKSLWRVTNGWKASASEGRVFCLKLTRQDDAPVYTLSSDTAQPFWNLRLDPTSASAYVNLARHDPCKSYKPPKPYISPRSPSDHSGSGGGGGGIGNGGASGERMKRCSIRRDTKHWYEALTTTLEEPSRKLPPNDGLVALLMPTAATKMAVQRAHDATSIEAASNECARLVWDEDTSTHYLVHNALAKPFCVTTERNPAYSRVEYTLEHDESPIHIAKLTRDGTGAGWLELDTRVASQISACYILDVVVTALLLVAMADEDRRGNCSSASLRTFAPPPTSEAGQAQRASWSSLSGRWSGMRDGSNNNGNKMSKKEKKKEKEKKRRDKMEEFEIDVESQDGSLGKQRRGSRCSREADDDEKLPFLARVVVKLTKGLFALVLWILALLFTCVAGVLKGVYKCVGSRY
ncbi:hypothetical protein E4U21_003093 [Claviceps maximensis]|nr:hypothetical protein E4U21_003093 [Claviceps maximensis]